MNILTLDDIKEINIFSLTEYKTKKGDKHEILSYSKLKDALDKAYQYGDIYDVAAELMIQITKAHAFASGNRRTAYFSAKRFLISNNKIFNIIDNPNNSKVFIGIREGAYTHDEIKNWIQKGQIKEFSRFK